MSEADLADNAADDGGDAKVLGRVDGRDPLRAQVLGVPGRDDPAHIEDAAITMRAAISVRWAARNPRPRRTAARLWPSIVAGPS